MAKSNKPAATRIYAVVDGGTTRLVEASSAAQAAMFVLKPDVKVVSSKELVEHFKAKRTIEKAVTQPGVP
jgi:hypothetical protein